MFFRIGHLFIKKGFKKKKNQKTGVPVAFGHTNFRPMVDNARPLKTLGP